MKTIGITTTVPIEVLLAAGYRVIDLNNIFVISSDYAEYIEIAERDGFPKSSCAWIKGLYGVCIKNGINEIVGVMEGDCSNTKALVEVLTNRGIKVYHFGYPHSHKIGDIKASIDEFMNTFNVTLQDVEKIRQELMDIRHMAREIDMNTYIENKVSGFENHLWQVSMSDFNGDAAVYRNDIEAKLSEIKARKAFKRKVRLGYIGVPPMTCDIYDYVESLNAHFVYNEVQREFAFPRAEFASNIYEQYQDYTYVYDLEFRLHEIKKQISERRIDGLIHYTQAFCHRAIEDMVIKKEIKIPVLNIEGDKLNMLDSRTKLRIEAFIDMISDVKEMRA